IPGQTDPEHRHVDANARQPGENYANCEQVRIRHRPTSLESGTGMGKTETTRYVIVPHRPGRRTLLLSALVAGWLGTLVLVWIATSMHVAPGAPGMKSDLAAIRAELATAKARLDTLTQRKATLERSDQISRTANREL